MSAARDREHDKWIPWYVDDTPGWLMLSLAARGAMEGIARKLDKMGVLYLRRGLPSLALLLGRPWGEIEPALAELIASGKLAWDAAQCQLVDPEYGERRRRTGADRVAAHRARARTKSEPPPPDVTPVTLPPLHVTPVTVGNACSSLVSSDLISDLGSDAQGLDPAPPWWPDVLGSIEMGMGEKLDPAASWFRYGGHRAGKKPPMAPTAKDAQYWLTTVMVPELKAARAEAGRRNERDEAFKRDKLGVAPKAENSSAKFRQRDDWARTAGPPDAEAAERLSKLLGGTGR